MSRSALVCFAALFISGCATVALSPPAAAPSAATSAATVAPPPRPAAASGAPPSAASAPGTPPLRAFADLVKDAKESKGLFTLYEKEDKVYLELTPDQLGQLFFLQLNVNRGLPDERALSARRMVGSQVVSFKRHHNTVQLLARNFKHLADSGTPLARAVANVTSDSLLASVPVVSQPHAERKSFLVEANGIFFADLMNVGAAIEAGFRSGYAFDPRNSTFSAVRSTSTTTSLTLNAHYATARIPTPPPGAPSGAPVPTPTRATPDARSFFLGLHYSLARLPEIPMRARLADDRIGHFNVQQWNFSDDASAFARQYVIRRWRLERPDAESATNTLVEPKKPVTFWMDRTIPHEYRAAVREGVLEWNKAFERIGFKNALVVKQHEDNDETDSNDTMRASIHWVTDYLDGALAVGPSTYDPRTGEILDADISMGAGWARLPRRGARDSYYRPPGTRVAALALHQNHHQHSEYCDHGESLAEEASFATELLSLRGTLPSDGPEALAIAQSVVRNTVTHEVGHTLGLRHNFRASQIYTLAQTSDPAFVAQNGLAGSVMDYVALNVALKGETQGPLKGESLGPYDYWAIEYAYKVLPTQTEAAGLAAIAGRSAEPLLAYGTDEEVSTDGDGMDPDVNQRDLGHDPIAFAKRRLALTQELWTNAQTLPLEAGENYAIQRRRVDSGMSLMEQSVGFVVKFVGGVTYLRDHAGTGRATYTPIPAERQREALRFLSDIVFADGAFDFKPDFMNRLPTDNLDRQFESPQSVNVGERVARLQRGVLDRLYSDKVAQRILDAPKLVASANSTLGLDELYASVESVVWSELASNRDISIARRGLQREHAKRIAAALTRAGASPATAEARSLHRQTAKRLIAQLDGALRKPGLAATQRAHLDDIRDTLTAALQAVAPRTVS